MLKVPYVFNKNSLSLILSTMHNIFDLLKCM